MKTELIKVSKTETKLIFKIDKKELLEAENAALKELAPTVDVKGFRKGNVPSNVAKKHIDPAELSNNIIKIAIDLGLMTALKEHDINPLDHPKIDVTKFVPEQELEFNATITIVPEIKLPDYKKLTTKKNSVKVTDKDIKTVLEKIQNGFNQEKETTKPAKLKDKVQLAFKGFIDGEPFEGGQADDYALELGSNHFIPGFEEGIVGKKAGDKFDLKLKFPKDYHAKHLQDKPVLFSVKINKVLEITTPKIDDDLAKKAGEFKNLEELKTDIRKNLILQKEEETTRKYREELVDELADKTETSIPEILEQDQINSIKQSFLQNLSYQGMTLEHHLDHIGKTEDEWIKAELKPAAAKRVKSGLALAQLSKELKIDVSEDEIDKELNALKTQYANNQDAIKQLSQPLVRRDLRNNILTAKTIDKLVELNN